MTNNTLFDRCRINTNFENDTFVGIKKNENYFEVNFPLGYHLGKNEKEVRRDILLLLNTLSKHSEKKESEIFENIKDDNIINIPIQAYLFIIKDYFNRGYYKEREVNYSKSKRGKINWSKTIKTQKPIIQESEVYYLDYIVKLNRTNENQLITLIHEYCVWESFDKLGWLFTSFLPSKPKINLKTKTMMNIVADKLQNTYNDYNKELFKNMLSIINSQGNNTKSKFKYGTSRFEYVWEGIIDRVFGINNKEDYFPRTIWDINGKTKYNNPLEPDTIMIYDKKVYVLDAKYYKYGQTKDPIHLPETTSINKQITYGEYIAENEKFIENGERPQVFNAFLMPFDSSGNLLENDKPIKYIGIATSDWKTGEKSYENVVGVLLDVKYFMELDFKNTNEIAKLANEIEKHIV